MKTISYSENKKKNEKLLFEKKIIINKEENSIGSRLLFRYDTFKDFLNRSKNILKKNNNNNRKLTDNKTKYLNKYDIYNKNVFTFFNKSNKLNLPSLSEKTLKIKEILNNKKRISNKRYEENNINKNNTYNTYYYRNQYIDNIMQGCCSVFKMNLPKKKISNNKECFLYCKLNCRPIYLQKHNIGRQKNIANRSNNYKKSKMINSEPLYRKNLKILVNEETMTNASSYKTIDNYKNNDNKNPIKIFNKFESPKRISKSFLFNTFNKIKSIKHTI
jgi:hypothetical protein